MKLTTILFFLCFTFGCNSSSGSSEYVETQKMLTENKKDIFKIVENSSPEVKSQMMNYLTLCINNNEADYLKKSGKGRGYMQEFMKTVRFFVSKIEEAKSFQPDEQQMAAYYELKSRLERDKTYINRYILNREGIGNQTDNQRRRMYKIMLANDLPGYQEATMVTEKEFDKNIPFLVKNWERLSNEIKIYYDSKDMMRQLGR